MNLFRSEENAHNWSGFREGTEAGIVALPEMMAIMSTPRHRERLNGHYVSSAPGYAAEFLAKVKELTHNAPFWNP
jgi:hypothetical protein